MCGTQHGSGGVDHRGVANRFALLVLNPLHGLQLGHAVGVLGGTCDQGLDVVLDGRLVERVDLVSRRIMTRINMPKNPLDECKMWQPVETRQAGTSAHRHHYCHHQSPIIIPAT